MSAATQRAWSGVNRLGEQPTLEHSLREALFRRIERYLREGIRSLDTDTLFAAVEAATPVETLIRIVSAVPAAGLEQDPWAEALLRGAAIKQEAVGLAGGLLSSGEVAELLGITVAAVKQRQRRGKLLALPMSNGEWGYPARQFATGGRVHDGLPAVIAAFPEGTSPWIILTFLVNPVPGRETGLAFDALSNPAAVDALVRNARTYGEHGAPGSGFHDPSRS